MSGYESAYSGEYIPESLRVLTKRMENYRKNHLKLQTQSQTSAGSGSKIVVDLPASGMIDLGSITMCGKVKNQDSAASIELGFGGVGTLFQRVSVSIGGVVVDSINDYNKLFQHLKTWTTKDAHNRQAAIGGVVTTAAIVGTPAVYGDNGGTDLAAQLQYGAALQNNAGTPDVNVLNGIAKNAQRYHRKVAIAADGTKNFNYSNWLGFLGRGGYMQMDLLPAPVQIEVILDSNKAVAGAATADFSLEELYFKVASVEFPLLSKALYAMVGANRPLPIPYTRWVNFSFSNTAGAVVSNKFSLATGCLSNILVTSTPNTANARVAATAGQNVAQLLSQCSGSTGWYCEVDSRRQSQYDINMAREGYDWTLGQWGVRNDGEYDNLISSVGDHATNSGTSPSFNSKVALCGSLNYFNSSWLLPFSFSFNEYDADSASNISGVNTNGLSSSIALNATTGFQAVDHTTNIYCETKAILNIMPNRQIRVDY